MIQTCDFLVIGAGIVGLSTAYHLQKATNAKVIVIEKENAPAQHQSSHNSGVVHAGVYYAPGSLKAKFCKIGVEKTQAFCMQHQLPYEKTGKLIVATDEQELPHLQALYRRAQENGIPIHALDAKQTRELAPNISAISALLSPSTAITDYQKICEQLAQCIRDNGGAIHYSNPFTQATEYASYVDVRTPSMQFQAAKAIACTGLYADRVAKAFGAPVDFQIMPFRGEFYEVLNQPSDFVRHLIYPVPDPERPFLGVHITKKINGKFTVGPNAVLASSREGYRITDINPSDMWQSLRYAGFWHMLRKNAKPAITELYSALSKTAYLKRVQRYSPSIRRQDLRPYPAGVRAQAIDKSGNLIDDFKFIETARTLHVCNAPSPAATAFYPIGEYITQKITQTG
ncbi:L-2-hydroxyglutarate oxidase [Ostreibacterium oceani]|uniref:L-2-hydroxyglutarate oxidase n=1 Tax=Ostreibacterium oceani TaxID=2654998 RepID=A0A6N7EU37_9GAMM|nr:L-2-hydroxyglutarate oxidase [Ostreibacterium oceani]MPV85483.1 L-2-hydroxyglutarate oxidase [Ostreibacterium oceani]